MKETMSQIELLERRLAEYTDRKYCVCTGSGTGALVASLQSLELPEKSEVIVPSIVCPTVAFAVTYSCLKPVFCDIDICDYQIDPNSAVDSVSSNTKAIIPDNLFCQSYNTKAIREIADMHSLRIIEDAAQSLGGKCNGRKHGSFGDLSIVSFGHRKIIDGSSGVMTGGGGAVLTDDEKIYESVKAIAKKWDQYNARLVENVHLRMYDAFFSMCDQLYKKSDGYLNFYRAVPRIASFFRKMFIHRIESESARKVLDQLDNIEEKIRTRTKNAELYRKLLKSNEVKHPQYTGESGVYFRYCALLGLGSRQRFINEAAKKGIPISTLYHPLHLVYGSKQRLPKSEQVGSRIFNLPVDPSISKKRIEWIANQVNDIAFQFSEQ